MYLPNANIIVDYPSTEATTSLACLNCVRPCYMGRFFRRALSPDKCVRAQARQKLCDIFFLSMCYAVTMDPSLPFTLARIRPPAFLFRPKPQNLPTTNRTITFMYGSAYICVSDAANKCSVHRHTIMLANKRLAFLPHFSKVLEQSFTPRRKPNIIPDKECIYHFNRIAMNPYDIY